MTTDFSVTLADLRKAGACVKGYNKVVRAMQGKEFSKADAERATYIRFAHKGRVSLLDILASNGLDDALWALRCAPSAQRDARLFAVWCARRVQHLMTDQRSIDALDVAERHATGAASDEELTAAESAAWAAALAAALAAAEDADWAAARAAARAAQKEMFIDMCCGRAPWQTVSANKDE